MKKTLLFGGIGLALLIIIIVIVSLASGGGGKDNERRPKPSKGEKIVLQWWHPLDNKEQLLPIIEGFENENPKVKIKLIQPSLDNYELESTNALTAGNGPDVWSIPNSWIPREEGKLSFAPEGIFRKKRKDSTTNLQYVKGRYVPLVEQENMRESKLLGMPLFVDTLALYYNKSLLKSRMKELEKQNIKFNSNLFTIGPYSWNELADLVSTYTQIKDGKLAKPAIALGEASNVRHSQDIVAILMMQNGADIVSPDGLTAVFNLEKRKSSNELFYPGVKALEFYTKFSNPSDPLYTWNADMGDSYEAFKDGKVAMIFSYQEDLKLLFQQVPDFDLNVFPLPQIEGELKAKDIARYWTETVPKVSRHQDLAWSFISYLQKIGLSQYTAATRRPSPLKPKALPKSVIQRPYFGKPLKFQTQTAQNWYRGKDPEEFEKIFNSMIQAAALKPARIREFVDLAALKITKIIRAREGYKNIPGVTPQKDPSK